MRGGVAVTDPDWWQYLRSRPDLDEVNFWRPGGQPLTGLQPGEPLFFKLKGHHDAIGGFGMISRYERLAVWHAWSVFGPGNGVATEAALLERLGRLARGPMARDRLIGCVAVFGAVFFEDDELVDRPSDWSRNIVSLKQYDLTHGEGRRIWNDCLGASRRRPTRSRPRITRRSRGTTRVVFRS